MRVPERRLGSSSLHLAGDNGMLLITPSCSPGDLSVTFAGLFYHCSLSSLAWDNFLFGALLSPSTRLGNYSCALHKDVLSVSTVALHAEWL